MRTFAEITTAINRMIYDEGPPASDMQQAEMMTQLAEDLTEEAGELEYMDDEGKCGRWPE